LTGESIPTLPSRTFAVTSFWNPSNISS
jgi:hypothetical protein